MLLLVRSVCFSAQAQASYVVGSPVPLPLPRAHPSGWTRTQGLSRMDSHAPPLFGTPPIRMWTGRWLLFYHKAKSSWVGERELLPLTPRHVPD